MKNAAAEYAKLQNQNAKLLTLIAAELKNHQNRINTLTWGHCGDMQHSKQLMKELLTFLRNAYDEEKMHVQIEAEIAE